MVTWNVLECGRRPPVIRYLPSPKRFPFTDDFPPPPPYDSSYKYWQGHSLHVGTWIFISFTFLWGRRQRLKLIYFFFHFIYWLKSEKKGDSYLINGRGCATSVRWLQMQMLNKEIALNRRTFIGEIFHLIRICVHFHLFEFEFGNVSSPLVAKCNSRYLFPFVIICIVFFF